MFNCKKKTKPELLCRYMKMDGTFNRNSPEWTRLTESKMCKDRMLPRILIAWEVERSNH